MRVAVLFVATFVAGLLSACATPPQSVRAENAATDPVALRFESLKAMPARLTPFLRAMPKGGDLHNHLSGAIYAESYVAWATQSGLCWDKTALTFAKSPCDKPADKPAGKPLVDDCAKSSECYGAMIDALSVRNHQHGKASGHDQFFVTFGRFGLAGDGRQPDMLVEVLNRAASQNILYLELMTSPGMSAARQFAAKIPAGLDPVRAPAQYMQFLQQTLGADQLAREAADALLAVEAQARQTMNCTQAAPQPGCGVTVRYVAQVLRTLPENLVFAQIAMGFLVASQSPQVVGFNLVAPEDDRLSMAGYRRHMQAIGALRPMFPTVGITLHAGELAMGLVPPEELRFHVTDAVRVAGATRIGHGVSVLYEDNAEALLAEMARKGVLVEINLSSNDLILGVKGADHPFATYRAFGVPMALSTDDEGVSRIDLTHEYVRAVRTYDLGYLDVKQLSRNSLSYAFVAGASLWEDAERARPVVACSTDVLGGPTPSPGCAGHLAASDKARLQWRLEGAFRDFEANVSASAR